MPRSSKYAAFVFTLTLLAIAALAVAFPFWLASPARSNPNDPMSPMHNKGAGGGGPANTPTYTTTPGPGNLLADFENSPTSADDNWNEPIVVNADTTDGSTVSPAVWGAGTQTTGEGPGSTGSYCGCISGSLVEQQGSVFPYAYMALDVTPNGNTGDAGDAAAVSLAQWNTYDPNNGIQFDYKATAGEPTTSYVVQYITDNVADSQFYQYQFTPQDTAWHTLDVYFPGVSTIGAVFSQPNYGGGTQPLDLTATGAVQFKVVASTTSSENYGLCVDNVGFNPTPAPTPFVIGAEVFNGEQTPSLALDMWNQNINVVAFPLTVPSGGNATNVSTISPSSFEGTTGTDSNFPASSYYARIDGTVGAQDNGVFPYAYISFDLAQGGTNQTNFASCSPFATNYGFQFDYKAGSACTQYQVELISAGITNTAFWQYTWISQDTEWHTVDVYFPASSTWATPSAVWTPPNGVNVLTEPNYGSGGAAFDPTQVGAFEFKPVASTSAPVAYDLSIDNLTFAAPSNTTGGPPLDITAEGGTLTGGATMITDFEYAGQDENNFCDGGAGAFGVGPVSTNYDAGGITTMAVNESPWGPTSGIAANGPTLGGSSCVEMSGTLASVSQGQAGSYSPYVTFMAEFASGSYPENPSGVAYSGNIESLAPNKRLVFDYKAGANGVGEPVLVQMMTENTAGFPGTSNYAYYTYGFTPTDTNWHNMIIYFPDAAYSPQFVIPYTGCISWDPTQAQGIEIGPTAPATNPEQYDLYLDNLFLD